MLIPKYITLSIAGFILIAFSACQESAPAKRSATGGAKDTGKCSSLKLLDTETEDDDNDDEDGGDKVTYESHIKDIFEENCVSCHGGTQAPDLRSYDDFKDYFEAIIEQVESDKMPEPPMSLSQEDKELIMLWQENDFAEDSSSSDNEKDDESDSDKDGENEEEDEDC